jgi:peptidoglycan/LPS O-acetylase OafA/YrhL
LKLERSARTRIEVLDPLRLLAALSVVLYHYAFRGTADDHLTIVAVPEISHFARYGYLGVHLFFMISGFVIMYSSEGRTAAGFALSRWLRVYPGFLLCMTATALAMALVRDPGYSVTCDQWFVNLLIDAPLFGRPFIDGVYWTLVYEVTFYAWIAILLGLGAIPRWSSVIVPAWLLLSVLNETTIHSALLTRYVLTDQSGFFAIGMAIHELHQGRRAKLPWTTRTRRDSSSPPAFFASRPVLFLGFALAVALWQALRELPHLNTSYGVIFHPWIVSSLVVTSTALVASVLYVSHVPLRPAVTLAMGGLTYPLYLLHENFGFLIFNRVGEYIPHSLLVSCTAGAMVAGSWAVWRWAELPAQRIVASAIAGVLETITSFRQRTRTLDAPPVDCVPGAVGSHPEDNRTRHY